MTPSDTIVALATPPAAVALAVVRLSGPQAFAIALSLLERARHLRAQARGPRSHRRPGAGSLAAPSKSAINDSTNPQIDR